MALYRRIVWLYLALKYWCVEWYSDVHFPLRSPSLSPFPPPQAGSSGDGPSRPEGEASGGGAQQKSADIPPTSRPPSQDVVCLQSEHPRQGEGLLNASSGSLWFSAILPVDDYICITIYWCFIYLNISVTHKCLIEQWDFFFIYWIWPVQPFFTGSYYILSSLDV